MDTELTTAAILYGLIPICLVTYGVCLASALYSARESSIFKLDTTLEIDPFDICRLKRYLQASATTRMNSFLLPAKSLLARKKMYTEGDCIFLSLPESQSDQDNSILAIPPISPAAMFSQLGNSLSFIIMNGALVFLFNHLYSGSIVAELPFKVPAPLLSIMQNGVDHNYVTRSHISALSLYFLILLCAEPVTTLLLRLLLPYKQFVSSMQFSSSTMSSMMQNQGQMPAKGLGKNINKGALAEKEKENWKTSKPQHFLPNVHEDALTAMLANNVTH